MSTRAAWGVASVAFVTMSAGAAPGSREGRQHALGEKPVHLVPLHLGERVGMGEPHEQVLAGQGQKLSLEAQAVALGLGKRAPRGPDMEASGAALLLAGAAGHLQGRQALQHVGLLDAETAMGPQARPGAHGVVLRHQRVLDGGEHRQARVQRAIAARRRVQVEAVEGAARAELDERQRPFHHLLQGFRAFCLHELGGSWLFGRVTARGSTELRFLSEMLSPMKARARSAAFWPAASPSNR